MSATKYTLVVKFDNTQLALLQDAGYNVCVSKLVNGKYTVVWAGDTVSNKNTFEWTEEYQVFGAGKFEEGALVSAETDPPVDIALGQTAVLNKNGIMEQATGPTQGMSFKVKNQWMPCYLGVKQKVNGVFRDAFVDPSVTLIGTETFTPVITVIVFLHKTFQTGTMFTDTESEVCQVVYQGNAPQTVSYITDPKGKNNAGMWFKGSTPTPTPNALKSLAAVHRPTTALRGAKVPRDEHPEEHGFSAIIPQKYTVDGGFEVLPIGYDAFFITKLMNLHLSRELENTKALPPAGPTVKPTVQAVMTFDESESVHVFKEIVESRRTNGWTQVAGWSSLNISQPVRKGNTITVTLDHKDKTSGPTVPVIELWDRFHKSLGSYAPDKVVYV